MANNFFKIDRGLSLTPQGTEPANPQNGDIYYDDTLEVFRRYENGAWKTFSAGGGAKSYAIENDSTADDALGSNWGTFDDSSYPPADGSGGAVTATLTRTTSSPLQGNGSMLFTPGGQYDGARFQFTIDRADFARMMKIEFDYEIGTYASYTDGDLQLAIISASDSGFTTNLNVIQPAGHSILKVAGQETHVATFQSHATNLYYRVCMVQTTASTGYTVKFDNFKVGPQSVAYGAPVTDWQSYTPTWTASSNPAIGNGTLSGRWKRSGDTMLISIDLITGTSTTYGSGGWSFGIPSGYTIDLNKTGAQFATVLGTAQAHVTVSSNIYVGIVVRNNSNSVFVQATDGLSSTVWASTVPATWSAGTGDQRIGITFSVPIVGWSSNVVVSDSADTRVVAERHTSTVQQNLTQNAYTLISFATKSISTHNTFSTNVMTCSVPGLYRIKSQVSMPGSLGHATGEENRLAIYKNDVLFSENPDEIPTGFTGKYTIAHSDLVELKAGDTIKIYTYTTTNGLFTTTASGQVFFAANMLSGPAQIAASESVSASVNGTPQGITEETLTTISFGTTRHSSHGAGLVDTGNNRFVAIVAGVYEVNVRLWIDGTPNKNPTNCTCYARVNGGTDLYIHDVRVTNSGVLTSYSVGGSLQVRLLAGDYVDFRVYKDFNSGASTDNIIASRTFMEIKKVGNY